VFPTERIAVFADGCFWHKCPKCQIMTPANQAYWGPKLERNQQRDETTSAELKRQGWRVIRVWEHDIQLCPQKVLRRIASAIERRRAARDTSTQGYAQG